MSMTWSPEQLLAKLRAAANRGVLRGAHLVHERGTELLTSPPKSGRLYRRRGVTHQASAPGEAPASDTGRLVNSGDVYADPAALTARVNWSTNYAEALEKGTERMAPRPFGRRALAERVESIEGAVEEELRAEFP